MRAKLGTYYSRLVSRCVTEVTSRLPVERSREKLLSLTFDDGPTDAGTPELLEILAEHGLRATFFLVGANAQRHPDRVREIVQAGHTIGNHTFSHVDAWSVSRRTLFGELSRCTRVLEDLAATQVDQMRPPFGRMTASMLSWSRRRAQRIMLWDVMPPDFKPEVSSELIRRVLVDRVRPGSIVCLHDNAKSYRVTPEALRKSLPELRDSGWRFDGPQARAA